MGREVDERARALRERILAASRLGSSDSGSRRVAAEGDQTRAFLRPEREDDDGYDPFSDRPPLQAAVEEDPWR